PIAPRTARRTESRRACGCGSPTAASRLSSVPPRDSTPQRSSTSQAERRARTRPGLATHGGRVSEPAGRLARAFLALAVGDHPGLEGGLEERAETLELGRGLAHQLLVADVGQRHRAFAQEARHGRNVALQQRIVAVGSLESPSKKLST